MTNLRHIRRLLLDTHGGVMGGWALVMCQVVLLSILCLQLVGVKLEDIADFAVDTVDGLFGLF